MNGMGTEGIVNSALTVTTYNDFIDSNEIPTGAEVVLRCPDSLYPVEIPVYYVRSRTIDGNVTTWECSDLLYRLDAPVEFSDADFDVNGMISCRELLEKASSASRILTEFAGGSENYPDIASDIPRGQAEGKSAREIFETAASAFCGFWQASAENGCAVFVPFGSVYLAAGVASHTKIIDGGKKRITRITADNGGESFVVGAGSAAGETLIINSPAASESLVGAALGRLEDYTYEAWRIEKGVAYGFVHLGGLMLPDGSFKVCNNVTLYPSPGGLYFSASANSVSEDEFSYKNAVQRALNKKYEVGEIVPVEGGGVSVSKEGISVYINHNSPA